MHFRGKYIAFKEVITESKRSKNNSLFQKPIFILFKATNKGRREVEGKTQICNKICLQLKLTGS